MIERFWRTAKQLLGLRFYKRLLPRELTRRLEVSFFFYVHHRPHHGLGGATPEEMLSRSRPVHLDALPPPRGRPGEPAARAPFRIAHLAPHRRLPYLIQASAT